MPLSTAWNRAIYAVSAPLYDWLATPFERGRRRAIERLALEPGERILIVGCGTGLDLEFLPADVAVLAVDQAPAMADRTEARAERLDREVDTRVADGRNLAVPEGSVDAVLLHLVLSVVPAPAAMLEEAVRVLGADGRISIYDRFGPVEETHSLDAAAVGPTAGPTEPDGDRSLDQLLGEAGLVADDREPFLGGVYTVTVGRPS